MEIKRVAVIGAGLMGTGISQVVATGGYLVSVRDISSEILNRSKTKIEKRLNEQVHKGRLTETEAKDIMSKINFTEDLKAACEDVDFIIEAVPEDLDLKRKIFSEMDKISKTSTVFASNTSELSITSLGNSTNRPDKVIGAHWFFPPQVMKLIEIIVTQETSQETLEITLTFFKKIGKETIVCKDAPGFITSRAISAFVAECMRIFEEGIASIEDIDKAMRFGFNHPIGPFQLMDMSGLDVVYHSLKGLTKVYGERFKPSPKMAELVEKGNLGQKTGKGFYNYIRDDSK